ncbi:DUF881 domain-containing protein [Acetivibrio saccincola]|uniref:DUF881 domain-containing protein n=1 Tax=Acetivibrio saccincola TaxID=1677857 RepID=UPI002C3E01E4|nr:DUF881 domain-containing protein [Acetivibrio saccincola]HQD29605.1 DUF881 domain-containing protein [Acetivibrio saccincola]
MKNVVRIITMTLVCFSIGIMISWQYKSIANNNQLLVFQRTSIEALQEELIEQQRVNEELEERLKEVNKEIEYYSYAMDDIGKIDRTIKKEMREAQILAGLVDVKGKGVEIVIDSIYGKVFEVDILNIINQLRAWEAQAISVNGERVTALTEFELTEGDRYKINGMYYTIPYVIKAVLPPENIDYLVYMIKNIAEKEMYFEVKIEVKEEIIIPKIKDEGSLLKYVY